MNNLVAMPLLSGHQKAALHYAALGWHVFPCWPVVEGQCACGNPVCKSPGKHPISHLAPRGQNDATVDSQIIQNWWTQVPAANIAVYLGQSGLCAVDIDPRNGGDFTIDDLEGRHGQIETDVVQLTGGGGEHRIFQRPEGNLPGTLGKGVDLKLNGYIIVEPSNHISGGHYHWEASSNPLQGAIASPLPDWIRSLSPQSVISSDTQTVAHAIVDELQVQDLQAALPFIDSDERDIWYRVGMALHSTGDSRAYGWWSLWSQSSKKYDERDQYRVWRTFRLKGLSGLGLPTIFGMAQSSGWINTGRIGTVVELPIMAEQPADMAIPTSNQVPEHLLHFPVNMLEALAYWMEGFSREPQRQITVQGTLALASVLCGRIYRSTQGNDSSLYLMTLAGTGVGKNYIKIAIQNFLSESNCLNLLSGSGNTSSGAIFSALFDSPCHLQIIDEFGKQLQTARNQVNGQMKEAFTTLTEAYSMSRSTLRPKNYSNMHLTAEQRKQTPKNVVYNPSITLLGLATPGQVYDGLSSKDIEDGFLNRFVIVEATLEQSARQPMREQPLPEFMKIWANSIRKPALTNLTGFDTGYDQSVEPIKVNFSEEALSLFDNYYDSLREKEKAGEFIFPDLTRRYNENAMRLATALAVCDEPANPLITRQLAQWAIDYVDFYGKSLMEAVSNKVADSPYHRIYLFIKEMVKAAGKRGLAEWELVKKSRLYESTPQPLKDQVFIALQREEFLVQAVIPPQSGRGKPRKAWVACQYLEHTDD